MAVTELPAETTGPASSGRRLKPRLLLAIDAFVIVQAVGFSTGWIRLYKATTDSMKPSFSKGDWVFSERFTYLLREPRRDEIVLFRTDGLRIAPPGEIFLKRVAGLPGDRVRIADGKLFINDQHLPRGRKPADIQYANLPTSFCLESPGEVVTVPAGHFLLLGDNSKNSLDSRHLGMVPRANIVGRAICRH